MSKQYTRYAFYIHSGLHLWIVSRETLELLNISTERLNVKRPLHTTIDGKESDYFITTSFDYGCLLHWLQLANDWQSFDYALPNDFHQAYIKEHNRNPRGVWIYTADNLFGEFFSFDKMMDQLFATVESLIASNSFQTVQVN